jgi:hypothetical protein
VATELKAGWKRGASEKVSGGRASRTRNFHGTSLQKLHLLADFACVWHTNLDKNQKKREMRLGAIIVALATFIFGQRTKGWICRRRNHAR